MRVCHVSSGDMSGVAEGQGSLLRVGPTCGYEQCLRCCGVAAHSGEKIKVVHFFEKGEKKMVR